MELTKMELFKAMNDKHTNLRDCEGMIISPVASHTHTYSDADGKQIVSARRGKDSLLTTIGEDKMYFNGKEITLDVPAKIKDGRT